MALGPAIAIGSENFRELSRGNYIEDSSTIDEPRTLTVKSTVKSDARSSLSFKFTTFLNNIDGPDTNREVYIVIRGDQPSLTQTEVQADIAAIATFMADNTNYTRFMRGEV
jgi:hypothetical protein